MAKKLTNHQFLVKWIEDKMDWDMQAFLEDKLGYKDKHQLTKTIIKYSPMVRKQFKEIDTCD